MKLVEKTPLGSADINQFKTEGYVLLENAITADELKTLRTEFDNWVRDSRSESTSYGQQMDGRPRFSLEPGHSFEQPALRRIASPIELSQAYLDLVRNSIAADAVAQLIGPNIKFNNAKINSKHPGSATAVKYHQDFMFEPHTNDDLVTVLFFLDNLTPENGPLEIVPGSHLGPLYDHWHEGVYTGSVDSLVAGEAADKSVACYGVAGSACLMNTRLLHGSAPNLSNYPRTLYIVEYCAEDAYPLQLNHIPSKYVGDIIRGERTNRVRCSSYQMEFPEVPKGASFFEQQSRTIS